MGIQGRSSIDFCMILGPRFESLSGTNAEKSGTVYGFGSMFLSTPISWLKSEHLGLPQFSVRKEGIAKNNFLREHMNNVSRAHNQLVDDLALGQGLAN